MLFSSIIFLWIFLPVTFLAYRIIPHKLKNMFLLVMSMIFYFFGGIQYGILLLISISVNYIAGLLIDRFKARTVMCRMIFGASVLANLAFLFYYKYFNFCAEGVLAVLGKTDYILKEIALPLGISFYTFQALSYLIDLYCQKIKVQKNPFHLALYISFFPQLIAGPIVKYKEICDQIEDRRTELAKTAEGIRRFIYGMAKKVIIANTMAYIADLIFAAAPETLSTAMAWVGAAAYALQIYFDFSGYSDMAIGLGKMFGFTFAENFDTPYMSGSISEFWRRWHISMTSWFRDYIYIPLGGNRRGYGRTLINTAIVFLATGIWHGANVTFIVWGLFNGLMIIAERCGLEKILAKDRIGIFRRTYTLVMVLIGWVLFRSDDLAYAFSYIGRMFVLSNPHTLGVTWYEIINVQNIVIFIAGILGSGLHKVILEKLKLTKLTNSYVEAAYCGLLLILSILLLISNTYNPFIYFRF